LAKTQGGNGHLGELILIMKFSKITSSHQLSIKNLLPELGKFYDGHENAKFFNQLIDKDKKDNNGYFTIKKEIWSVLGDQSEFCGFVCLNYKRGNTVKIGPIMVSPNCRGIGIGKFMIKSTLEKLEKETVRKVYATTSDENTPANKLFKNTGFQLEVELPEQYRAGNKENIWGYFFERPTEIFLNEKSLLSQEDSVDESLQIKEFSSETDTQYLQKIIKIIKEWHDDIDSGFLKQIIDATRRGLDFETKGKLILIAKNSKDLPLGLAIAAPKRGGSVKIYPMSGNVNSIKMMIGELKTIFKKQGYRKLYTFVHASDDKYIQQLINFGFCLRGTILSPYKSGHDLAVLDLFI